MNYAVDTVLRNKQRNKTNFSEWSFPLQNYVGTISSNEPLKSQSQCHHFTSHDHLIITCTEYRDSVFRIPTSYLGYGHPDKSDGWETDVSITVVKIQVKIWVVTPYTDVVGYTNISEDYVASIFRAKWRRRSQHSPPKCWYPTTILHGVTAQKISTWIFTTVKTSNLA